MRLVIASDHFGLQLKNALAEHLRGEGYELTDLGVHTPDPVDYPDVAEQLALLVSSEEYERGILICGTGIGMAIVANKVPRVRAANVNDIYQAERAAKSNDANVLTMGSQVIGLESAKKLADAWLSSEFAGGRSAPKVEKIRLIDEKYRRNAGTSP